MSAADRDPLAPLFAAPLKAFVAERKLLADRLRVSGQPKEAKEILKMPRPSLPAWTVNQLARTEAPLLKRLVEITVRLQQAQGPGAGANRVDHTAEALTAHREVLKQLRDRAERILIASGQTVRPQILERVLRNLRIGLASAETRPTIESGRLVHDVAEQDFVSLLGRSGESPEGVEVIAPRAAGVAPPTPPPSKVARDSHLREAEESRARARAETERARVRVEAERRLRTLRGEVQSARRTLEKAEADLEKVRGALAAAESHHQEARVAAERAAKDLQAAEGRPSG